jgi:hypothetical protein
MLHLNPFLLQKVDEILFYEWDPIGVKGHLQARDEYGNYAGGICRMLQQGADEYKLARHLSALARDLMGLSHVDEERDGRIARRLLSAMESCDGSDPYRSAKRRKE